MKKIILPYDDERSLTEFYGPPCDEDSLVQFHLPQGMRLYGGELISVHRCHRMVQESLEEALQAVRDSLGASRFQSEGWFNYCGVFNCRRKRGGTSPSVHSWGVAIDLDADRNPFRSEERTLSDAGIDVMEYHGWLSGGRAWNHDYMHFQRAVFRGVTRGSRYERTGFPSWITM
jgi:hypothetical protein